MFVVDVGKLYSVILGQTPLRWTLSCSDHSALCPEPIWNDSCLWSPTGETKGGLGRPPGGKEGQDHAPTTTSDLPSRYDQYNRNGHQLILIKAP